jgi:deoxyhypusine synthase
MNNVIFSVIKLIGILTLIGAFCYHSIKLGLERINQIYNKENNAEVFTKTYDPLIKKMTEDIKNGSLKLSNFKFISTLQAIIYCIKHNNHYSI